MKRSLPPTVVLGAALIVVACSDRVDPHQGDPSARGGSPTVRRAFDRQEDDPYTSNDETDDQPLGHFGTLTVEITSLDSGNTYSLDADINGFEVDRIYFPKGGWVDFYGCEVDADLTGECEDEEGRWWSLEGESSWSTSTVVDEEEDENYSYVDEDLEEGTDEDDSYEDDGDDDEDQW